MPPCCNRSYSPLRRPSLMRVLRMRSPATRACALRLQTRSPRPQPSSKPPKRRKSRRRRRPCPTERRGRRIPPPSCPLTMMIRMRMLRASKAPLRLRRFHARRRQRKNPVPTSPHFSTEAHMSISIAKLLREFVYNGVNLADPGPTFTPDEVRDLYSAQYPELTTAAIDGPEYS